MGFDPQCPQKSAYIMKDIDKNVKWYQLKNEFEEAYDLFKDGILEIYPTPGHTPGHLSLLINLPNSKSLFLTSDSCHTDENLYDNITPDLVWDIESSARILNWIRKLQSKNIEIVTGHDPNTWKKFKKAPEYYS